MTNIDLDYSDDLDDEELDEPFNLETFKTKCVDYSSKKLCEIIVCNRYLDFYAEASVVAMEELAKRRIAGDIFDFESSIESSLKELPRLDFSGIPDFRQIMIQAIGKKVNF